MCYIGKVFDGLCCSSTLSQEFRNAGLARMGSEESLRATLAMVIRVNNPINTTAHPNPALNGLRKPVLLLTGKSRTGSVLRIY